MKTDADKNIEKYVEQASDWDTDQNLRTKQSEGRAWKVAGGASFIALCLAVALMCLVPLKSLEYVVVRVDEVTGMVDVVRTTLKGVEETVSEATDKYWLKLYVRTREGYFYDEYQTNYATVGLMSSPAEQRKYYDAVKMENPAAPINAMSNKYRYRIKISTVTFIGKKKDLANVHYARIKEPVGGTALPETTYWIATIPFRYVNPPTSEAEREINPLGFQVADGYRTDSVAGEDRGAK